MKRQYGNWGTIFVSTLFFVMLGWLIYLSDVGPPENLLSIQGRLESLTPIHTKKQLTGFRFCIAKQRMTFTYEQPDLRVEQTMAAVDSASHITVLYAAHADRNPTLWGLEVDGRALPTADELRTARVGRLLWIILGFLVAGAVAGISILNAFAAPKRRGKLARKR